MTNQLQKAIDRFKARIEAEKNRPVFVMPDIVIVPPKEIVVADEVAKLQVLAAQLTEKVAVLSEIVDNAN